MTQPKTIIEDGFSRKRNKKNTDFLRLLKTYKRESSLNIHFADFSYTT